MTPTNEAGHGLPELPDIGTLSGVLWRDYLTTEQVDELSRSLHKWLVLRSESNAALALSRGVPEAARAYLMGNDLYSLLTDIQNGIDSAATMGAANSLIVRLDRIRESLTAAPAAAGAHQSSNPNPVTPGLSSESGASVSERTVADDLLGFIGEGWPVDPTRITVIKNPQYAAADGDVRERAVDLLANEYTREGWLWVANNLRDGFKNEWQDCALRAIEAALSSHRQAGECEISGIIEGQFNDDGDLTNRLDWRVFRDDDGYIWLTTDDPAKDHLLYLDDESADPPPGADLSKFRELAERWRAGVGIDLETRLQCADELLALVEKGAGNG